MHTEYRLIFFIKKVRLSVAKLKKMHMILFDHKLQQAIAKEKESAATGSRLAASGSKIDKARQTQGTDASSDFNESSEARDLENVKQLVVQLRKKMQSSFKLILYMYFVLEGYNEFTMQQDQVLLNRKGIRIEVPDDALREGSKGD